MADRQPPSLKGEEGSGLSWETVLLLLAAALAVAVLTAATVAGIAGLRKKSGPGSGVSVLEGGGSRVPPDAPKPKKGEVRRRKEPRPPFRGQRLKIYIPGRQPMKVGGGAGGRAEGHGAEAGPEPEGERASGSPGAQAGAGLSEPDRNGSAEPVRGNEGPAPSEKEKLDSNAVRFGSEDVARGSEKCPKCGTELSGPGGPCQTCEAEERVNRAAELVTSLRLKGVEVLEAERYIYQARSALALRALEDVLQLCAKAEEKARQLEAEQKEAQELVARCEAEISAAEKDGRNTAVARRALARALAFLRQGSYLEAMEEAATVPSLIGPPFSEKGPARTGAIRRFPGSAARCQVCGEGVSESSLTCPLCGSSTGLSGKTPQEFCRGCGERIEPGWKTCPSCETPIEKRAELWTGRCPSCGREVLAEWSLCPHCEAKIPGGGRRARSSSGPRVVREERGEPPVIPPEERKRALLHEIEEVTKLLREVEGRGIDARKGWNLLDLARAFTRNGNYEKGERYVRKARYVAETMLGE
ncbi:MAG: zinc ribbon domain-containing protein [Thermoplasmata archaeon]